MKEITIKAIRAFHDGIDNVDRKRKEWGDFEKQVQKIFSMAVEMAKKNGFFENLYIESSKTTSSLQQKNKNFISLRFGKHPNDIWERERASVVKMAAL